MANTVRTHAFTIFAMSSIMVDFFFASFLIASRNTDFKIQVKKIAWNKLNPPNVQLGWQQQHMDSTQMQLKLIVYIQTFVSREF